MNKRKILGHKKKDTLPFTLPQEGIRIFRCKFMGIVSIVDITGESINFHSEMVLSL